MRHVAAKFPGGARADEARVARQALAVIRELLAEPAALEDVGALAAAIERQVAAGLGEPTVAEGTIEPDSPAARYPAHGRFGR